MKVLVIAPHPDDETLGCGGSLFRHIEKGDDVYWLIVTTVSNDLGWSQHLIDKRQKELNQVNEKYGFRKRFNFNLPATKLDTLPITNIIDRLKDVFNEVRPELIYMPYSNDVHTDHKVICSALQSTFKWFRYPYIKRILMYETLSETEYNYLDGDCFRPNVFIEISKYIDAKVSAMEIYESEMGSFPFPRSVEAIRALAKLRGSNSGFEFAEAFQLVYERK